MITLLFVTSLQFYCQLNLSFRTLPYAHWSLLPFDATSKHANHVYVHTLYAATNFHHGMAVMSWSPNFTLGVRNVTLHFFSLFSCSAHTLKFRPLRALFIGSSHIQRCNHRAYRPSNVSPLTWIQNLLQTFLLAYLAQSLSKTLILEEYLRVLTIFLQIIYHTMLPY